MHVFLPVNAGDLACFAARIAHRVAAAWQCCHFVYIIRTCQIRYGLKRGVHVSYFLQVLRLQYLVAGPRQLQGKHVLCHVLMWEGKNQQSLTTLLHSGTLQDPILTQLSLSVMPVSPQSRLPMLAQQ